MNMNTTRDLAIFTLFVLFGILFATGFIALADDFKEFVALLFLGVN